MFFLYNSINIFIPKKIKISTFIKNNADDGACLYIKCNNVSINGSTFENNNATFNGGGADVQTYLKQVLSPPGLASHFPFFGYSN